MFKIYIAKIMIGALVIINSQIQPVVSQQDETDNVSVEVMRISEEGDNKANLLVYVEGEDELERFFLVDRFKSHTKEEQIYEVFEKIKGINYNNKQVQFIPEHTQILNTTFEEEHCTIVFNKDILSYGGTAYETYMINQLAYNFLSVEGIDSITFLIAERGTLFVEGTEIVRVGWPELMERMKTE